MSIRLTCRSCRAAFLTTDDQLGRSVACPKCGVKQPVPTTATLAGPAVRETSVFVESDAPRRPKRRSPAVWLLLVLVPVLGVAGVVAWPTIRAWLHPTPPDPIEQVASGYLQSLIDGNSETSRRLSTIEEPPAIRRFKNVGHQRERDRTLKGSFAPIAALHSRINASFTYDPTSGRFQTKNQLGAAAETLDALHDAKKKAEQQELSKKMQSGNPDDVFDAAEKLASTFSNLAEGVLSPQKLIPSYKQLLLGAKPPLPPAENELAMDYATHREIWDALLKRPFPTLKADGPYILDRAEVTAQVTDALASSGDPPTRLHLKLVRFRLEGIDTGWKVVSARREGAPEPAPEPADTASEPPVELPKVSPGEMTH